MGCTQNINIGNSNIGLELDLNTQDNNLQEEWLELQDDIFFKEMPVYDDLNNNQHNLVDVVTVFKFKANKFNYSLAQDTNESKTVTEWQEAEDALFVSNGSYFLEDNQPAQILKIAGGKYGSNLTASTVGEVVIDSNNDLNILADASITDYDNIMQSYPLLQSIKEDSGQTAPRSVIAIDNNDNVLFIYTKNYYFSLYQLNQFLNNSDLAIKIALNLDGGPSSGFAYLQDKISESASVPNVIIIKNK